MKRANKCNVKETGRLFGTDLKNQTYRDLNRPGRLTNRATSCRLMDGYPEILVGCFGSLDAMQIVYHVYEFLAHW